MKTETYNIEGMHCGHCTAMVKKSLEFVQGVSSVDVSISSATVSYDEAVTSSTDVEAAITRFGYNIRDY